MSDTSGALPALVTIVLGTRPEAIKLAPVIRAFREADDLHTRVVHAIERDLGSAIIANNHPIGIGRVNPEVMVIAVGRTDRVELLSAVFRPPELDVHDVHFLAIFRSGIDARVIPGSLPQIAIVIDPLPGRARVIAAK